MSIPQTNSEVNGSGTPRLYLLQMDSNFSSRSNDPQIVPIHILNNIADFNCKQFLRLKQANDVVEGQDQTDLLVDACPQSAVKVVAIQGNKNYQKDQNHLLPYQLHQHSIVSNIPSCVTPKELSEDISGTELISPALLNITEQDLSLAYKKNGIKDFVHISDRIVLPRAIAVLPAVLQIRRQDMIYPRRTLPPRARFGPVQGIKHKISSTETDELVMNASENKGPLFILRAEDKFNIYIDTSDKDKSNWIGLLPLGDDTTANVWIYEDNNDLYIITTEAVPSRKQLMLGYSKNYANDYGLTGPVKDIEAESLLNQKSWWCYECQRAMASATLLQRHMNTEHQADNPGSRRRYRCRHCTRTFSRRFTLRRHVSLHCQKKLSKSDTVASTDTLPEASLNSSLNTEDNRVPSDESFQNYSNGLDFSTNLFDTDRMPSLYLTGNSRSEVFTPYGLDSENPLSNDLGYTNGCSNKTDIPTNLHNEEQVQEKRTESVPIPCPYCKQNVAKGKKRQHVNECPARRFECECKKIFPNKEQLATHVFTQHSNKKEVDEQEQKGESNIEAKSESDTPQNPTPYMCEQCQHSFKRRGMLVNHMWRVHRTAAARIPLQRRVRYYPCATCPKIYRTAAKRDRHVRVHHPGAEKVRCAPVEGGTRLCVAAACSACPRQYATRAKLLQHLRCCHPHLVPPPPKKSNLTHKANNESDRLKASEELFKNKTSLQPLLILY